MKYGVDITCGAIAVGALLLSLVGVFPDPDSANPSTSLNSLSEFVAVEHILKAEPTEAFKAGRILESHGLNISTIRKDKVVENDSTQKDLTDAVRWSRIKVVTCREYSAIQFGKDSPKTEEEKQKQEAERLKVESENLALRDSILPALEPFLPQSNPW